MSPRARFYIFAGLLVILFLFSALALCGVFSQWEPPFIVKRVEIR